MEKRKTKTYIKIGGDLRKNRKKEKNNHRDHHENGHENQRKLKTTGKKEKKRNAYICTCIEMEEKQLCRR